MLLSNDVDNAQLAPIGPVQEMFTLVISSGYVQLRFTSPPLSTDALLGCSVKFKTV